MELITYASLEILPHMREEDIRILDAVNVFGIGVKPDGTAYFSTDVDFSFIKKFRSINPNLKFLLMLGGCEHCSDAFVRKSGRERFADTLMELLLKYDLDGLDNDWEVPTMTLGKVKGRPEDKLTYTMLMRTIRQRMDAEEARTGRHYLLTCAQSANRFIEDTIEVQKVAEVCDYINVMTYDLRGVHAHFEMHDDLGVPAGHHTNTYASDGDIDGICAERAVEFFRAWGVPDEKIVIGSGLYAKHFTNASAENYGLMSWTHTQEQYYSTNETRSYLLESTKDSYTRHWDDAAKACWLYSEEKRDFISYEDEESLYYKVDYVKKEGLRGLMFWHYACDDLHTLIPAAWKAAQGEKSF